MFTFSSFYKKKIRVIGDRDSRREFIDIIISVRFESSLMITATKRLDIFPLDILLEIF